MALKKLIAFDEEDLAVLAAYLQDAKLESRDMIFLPREQRFALVAHRFAREEASGKIKCRPAGVHFERVQSVKYAGVDPKAQQSLQLLTLQFRPQNAPSGTLSLVFAGGGEIRLDVECLEAAMSDLSAGKADSPCPQHALDR